MNSDSDSVVIQIFIGVSATVLAAGVLAVPGLQARLPNVLGDEVGESVSGADAAVGLAPDVSSPLTRSILTGTWDGRYRCGQGISGLTLTLEADDDGKLRALFEFYPLPENPDVVSGSFVLSGMANRQSVQLQPEYWVDRPPGHDMVGLLSDLPDGDPPELAGSVTGLADCRRFDVVKTSPVGKEIPL